MGEKDIEGSDGGRCLRIREDPHGLGVGVYRLEVSRQQDKPGRRVSRARASPYAETYLGCKGLERPGKIGGQCHPSLKIKTDTPSAWTAGRRWNGHRSERARLHCRHAAGMLSAAPLPVQVPPTPRAVVPAKSRYSGASAVSHFSVPEPSAFLSSLTLFAGTPAGSNSRRMTGQSGGPEDCRHQRRRSRVFLGVTPSWDATKGPWHPYDVKGFDSSQTGWTSADQKLSGSITTQSTGCTTQSTSWTFARRTSMWFMRAAERARAAFENARAKLNSHIAEHGCS
jgi:hypothetical protein